VHVVLLLIIYLLYPERAVLLVLYNPIFKPGYTDLCITLKTAVIWNDMIYVI